MSDVAHTLYYQAHAPVPERKKAMMTKSGNEAMAAAAYRKGSKTSVRCPLECFLRHVGCRMHAELKGRLLLDMLKHDGACRSAITSLTS